MRLVQKDGLKLIYTPYAIGHSFREKRLISCANAVVALNTTDYAAALKMRPNGVFAIPGFGVQTERFHIDDCDKEKASGTWNGK